MYINFGCSASQAAQFAGKKGGKKQPPKERQFPITTQALGEEGGLSPIPVPKKPGKGKQTPPPQEPITTQALGEEGGA